MLKSRIALLALASVCSGLAAVGCSSENPTDGSEVGVEEFEKVEFNLNVNGASVTTVDYEVKKSDGSLIKSGTFEVPGSDDSFSAQLLLPVGTGYTMTISGTGVKGGNDIPCAGTGTFNVVAGTNPPVDMTVVCKETVVEGNTKPVTGSVKANVNFVLETEIVAGEECGFTNAVVGPLAQLVGSKIDLKSVYVPASADASWSATGVVGVFADASADDTTFACGAAGVGTITATLSTPGGCTDTFAVQVECIGTGTGPVCGDGVVEAPEVCEPSLNVNCAADCSGVNPYCGDGLVTAGETCETCEADVLAVNGPAACDVPPVCGDGVVEAPEVCEPASTPNCLADCSGIAPVCGDGAVNQASEECDDSNTLSNDGCSNLCKIEFCGDSIVNNGEQCEPTLDANCNSQCQFVLCGNGVVDTGETCETCPVDLGATCNPPDATCGECMQTDANAVATGLTSYYEALCSADPLCQASLTCLAESGCFGASNGSQLCYCGVTAAGTTVEVAECISPAFVPTGVCAAEMRAGSGTDNPTNQQILERQFDFTLPSGTAFGLAAFARDNNICTDVCGLQ